MTKHPSSYRLRAAIVGDFSMIVSTYKYIPGSVTHRLQSDISHI